ncbi:hypothetical protein Mal64_27380 [Pseudobythopirellula maris]|uniref:DUF1552 domain-containing protein n=1 Tax=Pseudobythopirellula maris TaxID=2527991 RepID=A0A5C5ZJ64_9BACT|nr:DUF1552 domain-containing protein [Pseudobythopirellula maris]TWT87200.1 hypothetical protein Mal64_27380 [Pseudobythopirellula maris]
MSTPSEQPSGFGRRRFLRGAGVCLALPLLESLGGRAAAASVTGEPAIGLTASGAPLRTAFVSFPNGAIPAAWRPVGIGPKFAFGRTLEALEPVRDMVQVLGGLDLEAAKAGRDGAGDHARGNGTFLTTVRLHKSATDVRAGVSIDQEIARRIGDQTRFPSLELTGDTHRSTNCDSGYACAYQYNISWKSPTTPMTAESNPRLVFERLFGAGPREKRSASLRQRRNEQRSVLDFVMDETRSLARTAGRADRAKLDEYLSAVRESERRIAKSESFGAAPNPDREAPHGVSENYEEYITQMFDLMLLAFQTDSTRVATFQMAHDGSSRSFDHIGIHEGHHGLTHHRSDPERIKKVEEIDRWYASQFARFLERLDATEDSDGRSLLYNSQIVYGSGNSDGNRHTHDNLPIVLAGAAGGAYRTGRYMDHGSRPLANLYLKMAETAGASDLKRFGDSTEALRNV